MPIVQCQKCSKPVDYTPKQEGKALPCPHCGETNILPGAVALSKSATDADPALARGLPPWNGPETAVMTIHQSMFGSKPFSFLVLCLAVLGGFGFGIFFFVTGFIPAAITCAAVGLLCLLTLIFWRMVRRSRRLEVTTRRIFDKQGLLSKRVNEIRITDIRDMQVIQSFSERILGVGRLSISTAGQSDYEIEITDIPSPNKVREVIDLYRRI